MKAVMLMIGLLGGIIVLSASEANAVVCARGVYRAGCAGVAGAAVVRRPVVAPRVGVGVRRGVVVRR